jgi:hypothetical protein
MNATCSLGDEGNNDKEHKDNTLLSLQFFTWEFFFL